MIPERYFERAAQGKPIWAPHDTVRKTLMGLVDLNTYTGNEQALDIACNWAKWFHRWSGTFTRSQFDDILDMETGGMLEVWANLYAFTGAVIARYLESATHVQIGDADVAFEIAKDEFNYSAISNRNTSGYQHLTPAQTRAAHNPMQCAYQIRVRADGPSKWTLLLAVPEWAEMELTVNGAQIDAAPGTGGFVRIEREWLDDAFLVTLARRLRIEPLPDRPDTVAFLDGDTVLVGLTEDDTVITYEESPEDALAVFNEREWGRWTNTYRTQGQAKNMTFVPLNEIGYEAYTIYFPTRKRNP